MDAKDIKPILKEKILIKKPRKFKVIFFNDDYTPFFFVVKILNVIFNKTEEEAQAIANKIHAEGKEVIGIYPQEIAETKHAQTMYNAQQNGFPLHCEIEPEEFEE
jgi:ATP-dependent Clp protease adaptor protein ClpS